MDPRRLVRLLVLAEVVTGAVPIAAAFLLPYTEAPGPPPLMSEIILGTIWSIGWIVALVALWRFIHWGPALYAATALLGLIVMGLETSLTFQPGGSAMLALEWLITGLTIGVTQYSPAASLFARERLPN